MLLRCLCVLSLVACGKVETATFSLTLSDPDMWCDIAVDQPPGTRLTTGPGQDSLTLAYTDGAVVRLTATPHAGYGFGSWMGTDDDTANPTTITMVSDETVSLSCPSLTAATGGGSYTLTLNVTGNGTVTPDVLGPYAPGTLVHLTAAPHAGHKVGSWTGTDVTPGAGVNSNTLTINANATVSVAIVCDTTCTLTLDTSCAPDTSGCFAFGYIGASGSTGTGNYDQTVDSAQVEFPVGDLVTLTAHDSLDWGLSSWSGTTENSSACVNHVTMSQDITVTAAFPQSVVSHCP